MNFDRVIARAAPPPERTGTGPFEPVPDDPKALALRRTALVRAFGSEDALAAHAESIGLAPEEWIARFGGVRLAGPDPDWAELFREVGGRLQDGVDRPFRKARHWIRKRAEAAWPAALPRGPEALDKPLDYLADRIGGAIGQVLLSDRHFGVRPTWAERFDRNPALAYVIGQATADWLADIARILADTARDRDLLAAELFGGDDPGRLLAIEPGLGDPHAGGRSVAILRFERGAAVYKPKDLRVAAVTGEIARLAGVPGVEPPRVLLRGDHAWEPEHAARPLAGRAEADAFFRAMGAWLAVLQGLGASDIWFDNLIVDGPVPRVIDLETAVQPPPVWPEEVGAVTGTAAEALALAPTGVGILPMLNPIREGDDPTDLGCFARPGEHSTPIPDTLRPGEVVTWSEDRFAPRLADGTHLDVIDHFEAFEDGYRRAAGRFAEPTVQRRAVEALRRVGDAPVRVIRMDTWAAYRAIQFSCMPKHLADGAWREAVLHTLVQPVSLLKGQLREAAVDGLRRLDVPLFQAGIHSRDLLGTGGEVETGHFTESALEGVEGRLARLAAMPMEERDAWLRSGFSVRPGNPPRRPAMRRGKAAADPADALAWAEEIAAFVEARALADDRGTPTWMGLVLNVFTGFQTIGPLDGDLLAGRTGVALALRELAEPLGRPALADLARETLEGIARDYLAFPAADARYGPGHAVGVGGLVAALAADPELRQLADRAYATACSRKTWMYGGEDLVSGLAGWRLAARALGHEAPAAHGPERRYAPLTRPRLAPWLDPARARILCADLVDAARLRRGRERHGSWFPERWIDDRHDLSGVDGLPALAVRLALLGRGGETAGLPYLPAPGG